MGSGRSCAFFRGHISISPIRETSYLKPNFLNYFAELTSMIWYFTPERFKPGSSGEGDLVQFLNSNIF